MKKLGLILYFLGGLVSFFWSIAIVVEELGFLGGLIAFFAFPFTIVVTPLIHGFNSGDWTLAAVTYGSGIVAAIIYSLGSDSTPTHKISFPIPKELSISNPKNISTPSISEPSLENDSLAAIKARSTSETPVFPVWLIIIVLVAIWKGADTNPRFGAGYTAAFYVTGLCLAGLFWLFSSKARSSWTLGRWFNNGAYCMIALLVLSPLVRIAVEDMLDKQQRGYQQSASSASRRESKYPVGSQSYSTPRRPSSSSATPNTGLPSGWSKTVTPVPYVASISSDAWVTKVKDLAKGQDWNGVISQAKGRLKAVPDDAQAYSALALAYSHLGDSELAAYYYKISEQLER